MDKGDKRRSKQLAAPSDSIIAKYRHDDDDEDKADQWRKYRRGRNQPAYHDRSESVRRRQTNPSTVTAMGYDYSADMSRLRRYHVSSSGASRTKYQNPSVPEDVYRAGDKNHGILKALRCYPNNYAVVRKSCYKDGEDDDRKYVDADQVDDEPETETGEEIVDEEHENLSEYTDKDYEEQEADDEVDEGSDVLEPQMERIKTQRKSRVDPPMRAQKTSHIEPSHYHHHEEKIGTEKTPQRCCHVANERDVIDVPTEDDEDRRALCQGITCPTIKTTRRYHGLRDKESRTIPRNFVERYSDFNKRMTGSDHQNRRPRTTKPEMESPTTLARVHHGPILNNRCSKCGVLTGQKPKTRYYTRIPIGDECEYFEDLEPSIPYQTKSRRSKESKSPDYDPREESRILDAELGAIHKSCRTKIPRDLSNGHGEQTRHSSRVNNRHEPLLPSKNDNRYWK